MLVRLVGEDNMRAIVFNGPDAQDAIFPETFKKSRSRGKTVKSRTPKLISLHDPMGILPRQKAIEEAQRLGITLLELLEQKAAA